MGLTPTTPGLAVSNEIVGVTGMKGMGKSTFLSKVFSDRDALAVIDTLGEHGDPFSDKKGWCPPVPVQGSPETAIPAQVELLAEPPMSFKWSFMINPEYKDDKGRNLHFNALCRAAYLAGDMDFIIEEVDKWCNAGDMEPGLGLIVDYGRHRTINLTWASRNFPSVSRILTSQTDIFVLFAQQEPLYLESMSERFTDEIVQIVASLQPLEYVAVDRLKRFTRGKLSL